jgi:hypothetical protein
MEDYELLLIGAGLAFYNKRNNGSFAIKRNALEVFLRGHRFALHDISFDLNDKYKAIKTNEVLCPQDGEKIRRISREYRETDWSGWPIKYHPPRIK